MDWHVKPLARSCAATGDDLAPGSECYSALIERQGELVRLDFSPEAWQGPPDGAIGYWRTRVPKPAAPAVPQLDPDALLRYLEQLGEDPHPAHDKLRYVLALALLKKRRLRIEATRQDGDVQWLELVGTRSEGPFVIRDLGLDEYEIAELQSELHARLAAGWPQ